VPHGTPRTRRKEIFSEDVCWDILVAEMADVFLLNRTSMKSFSVKRTILFLFIVLALIGTVMTLIWTPTLPWRPWLAWPIGYHGRTLRSLGLIVSSDIDPRQPSPPTGYAPKWTPADVRELIDHATLGDYYYYSVPGGVPPFFTLVYADGTQVTAERYLVRIQLTDGRKQSFTLVTPSKEHHAVSQRPESR
jgi:hypothetical protein